MRDHAGERHADAPAFLIRDEGPQGAPQRASPRAASGPRPGDSEIRKLADLRAEGALTDAEFTAAKERLIGGEARWRTRPPTPSRSSAKPGVARFFVFTRWRSMTSSR